MTPASPGGGNPNRTQIIARNSFWYGLETLFGLCAVAASVLVARVIGPERLGPYLFVVLLTNVTASVGAFGLPVTTRKYMAEYLNRGSPGVARAIYRATLRLQLWIAGVVTVAGLSVVFARGDPAQRLYSAWLVVSMAPRMIGFIPAQANNAAETMRRNTLPAFCGGVFTVALTLFSLWAGWDLPGVAAAFALGATVEMLLKLRSVHAWLGCVVPDAVPPELRTKMFAYSGQGVALMILNIVVWDKSDMVILRELNPHREQLAFFGTAFNFTERLLMLPSTLAGSVGVTMMAQYGRDEDKLRAMTVNAGRYAFLIALPLLLGMACVSGPLVLLYGEKYRPMIPVLTVVAILAIPKALTSAPTNLLLTTANQGFLIVSGCVFGAIDVALDILLTPRHGALGAAVANGTAQTLAAIALWLYARRLFHLDLRLQAFARIALSGLGMAAAAFFVSRALPAYAGLAAGILSGALVWFVLLRFTGALDSADVERFLHIGRTLPKRFRPAWHILIRLLAPAGNAQRDPE